MAKLGPEGFKGFPTFVSQLDNPVVKQVLITLKDTWVTLGLASFAVEGYVLGILVHSEWLERRENDESGRFEVDSSVETIRRGYSTSGAFRFFASLQLGEAL
jgi:hypothetical protein